MTLLHLILGALTVGFPVLLTVAVVRGLRQRARAFAARMFNR